MQWFVQERPCKQSRNRDWVNSELLHNKKRRAICPPQRNYNCLEFPLHKDASIEWTLETWGEQEALVTLSRFPEVRIRDSELAVFVLVHSQLGSLVGDVKEVTAEMQPLVFGNLQRVVGMSISLSIGRGAAKHAAAADWDFSCVLIGGMRLQSINRYAGLNSDARSQRQIS